MHTNRSAIGARVDITVNGQWRLQEVSGGSGYCSQNSMVLYFGMGPSERAEKIAVRWPSGSVQILEDIAADRSLRITEVEALAPAAPPRLFALSSNYPNPFTSATSWNLFLTEAGHVEAIVFDLQGQHVRQLSAGEYSAGGHALEWRSENGAGDKMSNGIYFLRVALDTHGGRRETITRRLLLLR